MGLGGMNIWSLVLILVIVLLLFGTKKLRNLGGDLGGALKGFKKAMSEDEETEKQDTKKVESENAEDAKSDAEEKDKAGTH